MNYDFATYVAQQFQPTDRAIRQRIQWETQGLRRTQADRAKKRIIAEEMIRFAQRVTGSDMRLMGTVLSLIQMGHADYKEGIRQAWIDNATTSLAPSMQMGLFTEIASVGQRLSIVLPTLPCYSWYISLPIRLAEPFTSKDDGEMHVLENPVCRERVFGVPMVRPSTWKGNLRWMAVMAGLDREVRERLFGNETDEEKEFHAGRLFFFSTFFDHIDFEVLTPLDRERRFPKTGPILLECVRHRPDDGAKAGEFSLLYLAPPSAWQSPAEVARQVAADVKHTAAILKEMLLSYGFSAKKTSGFGVIEDDFRDQRGRKQGVLVLVGVSLPETEASGPGDKSTEPPTTRLSFGSCAEMCDQAKRLAQVLQEVCHE